MSTTNSRKLTVERNGAKVTIIVSYKAEFNPIERHLAELGMKFIERISVIGVDPPGDLTDVVLKNFPGKFIDVPAGVGTFSTGTLTSKIVLDRAELDEDSSPFLGPDTLPDEITCRIQIQSVGLPPPMTQEAFTNQEVLREQIVVQPAAGGN